MSALVVRGCWGVDFVSGSEVGDELHAGTPVVIVDAATWERRERAVAMLADWVDLHGTDTSQLTAETRTLLAEMDEEAT